MTDACVVCHRPGSALCETDRKATAQTLANLPARLDRLAYEIAAISAGPSGEHVTTSGKVEAKIPARMAVLSMDGPGASEVSQRLHPLMRHWSIRRTLTVHGHANGYATVYEQVVTDWYHEAVIGADGRPVLVTDDDQIGAVPPREWLDTTVRGWRYALGHHVPQRTILATSGEAARWLRLLRDKPVLEDGPDRMVAVGPLVRAGLDPALITAALLPALITQQSRAEHFGLTGYQAPAERSLDPLLDEVERRFGEPPAERALLMDIQYLLTWLDEAAERDLDMASFTAALHNLDAELAGVLGDDPEKVWIGRCPAFLADTSTGPDGEETVVRKPCGGGLWQDNAAFSAQVRCPRCGSVWDTHGPAAATLAREMRKVWPVDRRRRYNSDELDCLPALRCPTCKECVIIDWKDVTGTRDKRRWWQPAGCRCRRGCDEAGRLV